MTIAAEIHTLTGPYVLDAVDDDERVAFERHLAVCAACTAEINGLREAIAKSASSRRARLLPLS
jgi:anti-sigma factor RsiW